MIAKPQGLARLFHDEWNHEGSAFIVLHIFARPGSLFVRRLAREGLRLTLYGYQRGDGDRAWR